ncbi:flagellar hook-length control protein FliK [Tepidiphilus sp. J10]|uniref:flagellar hook-length control protein FliK n=1 Tax=Tepidiphilus sp. J10 TaxID=2502185 RepID=UPI00115CDCE7|nr:flagellar hook-length control protein FliK [Tepidiphilus sp. J10]
MNLQTVAPQGIDVLRGSSFTEAAKAAPTGDTFAQLLERRNAETRNASRENPSAPRPANEQPPSTTNATPEKRTDTPEPPAPAQPARDPVAPPAPTANGDATATAPAVVSETAQPPAVSDTNEEKTTPLDDTLPPSDPGLLPGAVILLSAPAASGGPSASEPKTDVLVPSGASAEIAVSPAVSAATSKSAESTASASLEAAAKHFRSIVLEDPSRSPASPTEDPERPLAPATPQPLQTAIERLLRDANESSVSVTPLPEHAQRSPRASRQGLPLPEGVVPPFDRGPKSDMTQATPITLQPDPLNTSEGVEKGTIPSGHPAEGSAASRHPALSSFSPAPASSPAAETRTLSVHTPPTEVERWASETTQRLVWLAGRGETKAELQLTPPSLGKLEISLIVNNDQLTAHFVAASQATRDALEHALPHLREQLAQAGMSLGQTSVSTGDSSDQQDQNGSASTPATNEGRSQASPAREEDVGRLLQRGLIDHYA